MSFTSAAFFGLLAVLLPLYYLLPRRQNLLLLAASMVCAAWAGWQPLAVLVPVILFVWAAGLALKKHPGCKRAVLWAGAAVLIGLLAVLKYSGLPVPGILLLGLSYYTLMAVGYLADVAAGRVPAQRSLLRVALFLSFFPQFTSGPIGRAGELMPQFDRPRAFSYEKFSCGATRMLWGAFKKLVVADSLGLLIVDPVFKAPAAFGGPLVLLAVLAYSYQLYCDFSGYTDMARGAAELFGIALRENFRRPFAAKSYAELWNRWHLSLSLWFRDYVYFPLGGSRNGTARMCLATMAVFALSGIWHDVGWLFLVWGVLCGVFVLAGKLTRAPAQALAAAIPGYNGSAAQRLWQLVRVYLIFSFCFVIFRVGSGGGTLADCLVVYRQIFADWRILLDIPRLFAQLKALSIGRKLVAYLSVSLLLCEGIDWLAARRGQAAAEWLRGLPVARRTLLYYLLALLVLFFGQMDASTFIYFQF